ncbi:MAG: carboxypeptidase regulatory-like domain-containing protein, partial [Acidobacteria bacterium]|nr:carboxypeptidase regulatory-like domain-containing protein [Acidobacteriota bacterium]
MTSQIGKRVVLLAALTILGGIGRLSAQVYTGRIDVVVEDSAGKKLAGVSVSVTGPMEATQISDVFGQAHFLNLPIGLFTVKGTMPGLTPFSSDRVEVVAGVATAVRVYLAAASNADGERAASATVTVDPGRAAVTTHAGLEELQNIPSARDPSVVLQTVPTVYVDQVNVGGAASGEQSTYLAKGALPADNTWGLEGVPVTDMGTAGASSFFYNFDGLQDLAVTTGGADVRS